MPNNCGIPEEALRKIRERDKTCVYCHKPMINPDSGGNRIDWATIEHLNHLPDWDSVRSFIHENKPVEEIVAICCGSCNSSRSDKSLPDWFKTPYCISRNINENTVAEVVKNYIINIAK